VTDTDPTSRPAAESLTAEFYSTGAVSEALAKALHCYRQEWESYRQEAFMALGLDAAEQFRSLLRTAEMLIRGAGDLASSQSLPLDQAVAGLDDGRDPQHQSDPTVVALAEALQYCLGRDAVKMVGSAEGRIWRLLLLTQQFQPGKRAAAFLRRVSRCYIYGFDPECAVMCRSVLEAAFEAEIADETCAQVLGRHKRPNRSASCGFDLADRIAVARRTGRLSEPAAARAAGIRMAGNEVIHEHPRACADAFRLIADTLDVIGELSRPAAG
jgi:hypothetical protein